MTWTAVVRWDGCCGPDPCDRADVTGDTEDQAVANAVALYGPGIHNYPASPFLAYTYESKGN